MLHAARRERYFTKCVRRSSSGVLDERRPPLVVADAGQVDFLYRIYGEGRLLTAVLLLLPRWMMERD